VKISTRILSVLIAAVMLITAIPFTASAKTASDIQEEIDKWEELIQENEENQADAQELIDKLEAQNKAYDEQIALLDKEIAPLQQKINELTEQINTLENKIKELVTEIADIELKTEEQNTEIDATYELLKDRMRADYMAGETSELELFLNSGSFEEFLVRSELLRQVAERDNQIIADLEVQIAELNEMLEELSAKKTENEESKLQIEADRKKVEDEKAVFDAKKAEQVAAYNKVKANLDKQNKLMEQYDENSEYYQKKKAQAEAEFAEWEKQLQSDAGNTGSTGDGYVSSGGNHNFKVSSKGYISPIQDKSVYYSATYAQHSSRGSKSVDFCAPARRYVFGGYHYTTNGAKIYAVASGTVVTSTLQTSGGEFIIIDHGNGMRTLYAHCKVRYVSVGQKVEQGDVIALVGNTGSAVYPKPTSSNPVAGSHLHFQMLLNGSPVNPEKYLPSPLVY